ncbi:hydantoinase B/oxoprolinase family protein [Paraburkholderia xenovorans]
MNSPTLDAVNLAIYWDRLISIADEIMLALVRTAFSSTVRETYDCSCNLFDAKGRSIAQASAAIPSFTGTAPLTLAHMLAAYPAETLKPGDVLITNDPWMSSGHMFDVSVMRPVFVGDRLVGYCLSVSHLPDIGGIGWSPESTSMYHEGLRLPITKMFDAGMRNEWLVRLILANVRVGDQVMGDLMANVACTAVGARLLVEFMQEYGIADLGPVADAILEQSEQAMRTSLRAMPDGTYNNEMTVEGMKGPVTIQCAVTIEGDSIHVDFGGSDPVGPWGMNVPMCYTRAMSGYAIKCLTLPTIPNNDGVLRPLKVIAPEGSILNPPPPAATAARHLVGHAIYPLLFGALSETLPDRVQAQSGGGNMLSVAGSHRGRDYSQLFFCSGGYGALRGFDGHNTTPAPSNPRGMPVEVWESQTGLTIEYKELLADSGGAGEARGGLGQRICMRNTGEHPVTVACFSGQTERGAAGMDGGKPGSLRKYWLNNEPVPPKRRHVLQPGDFLATHEAGGGGFGTPGNRPFDLLVRDFGNGFVTEEGLRRDYGQTSGQIAAIRSACAR